MRDVTYNLTLMIMQSLSLGLILALSVGLITSNVLATEHQSNSQVLSERSNSSILAQTNKRL